MDTLSLASAHSAAVYDDESVADARAFRRCSLRRGLARRSTRVSPTAALAAFGADARDNGGDTSRHGGS